MCRRGDGRGNGRYRDDHARTRPHRTRVIAGPVRMDKSGATGTRTRDLRMTGRRDLRAHNLEVAGSILPPLLRKALETAPFAYSDKIPRPTFAQLLPDSCETLREGLVLSALVLTSSPRASSTSSIAESTPSVPDRPRAAKRRVRT